MQDSTVLPAEHLTCQAKTALACRLQFSRYGVDCDYLAVDRELEARDACPISPLQRLSGITSQREDQR